MSDTIVPRLKAAGADLSRIVALNGVTYTDPESGQRGERGFTLADLPALEDAIRRAGDCRLVIIDPVTAYLPGQVDSHRNSDIRGVLAPLADLAARHGVAIACVSHLNKSGGAQAMYRTTGSLAFVAAARAAMLVTRDADDPRRRLILWVKLNVARMPPGLAYRIEPSPLDPDIGVVAWEPDPVEVSADDALAALVPKATGKAGAAPRRTMARDWLRSLLAAGPLPADTVKSEARAAGISTATLRRAADELGVKPAKIGMGGGWVWRLPAGDAPEDAHLGPKMLMSGDVSIFGEVEHLRDAGDGSDEAERAAIQALEAESERAATETRA